MIIVARILCNCGVDITKLDNATAIGSDCYCPECAVKVARNIMSGATNDPALRKRAIEILSLAAISNTPKEKRS